MQKEFKLYPYRDNYLTLPDDLLKKLEDALGSLREYITETYIVNDPSFPFPQSLAYELNFDTDAPPLMISLLGPPDFTPVVSLWSSSED